MKILSRIVIIIVIMFAEYVLGEMLSVSKSEESAKRLKVLTTRLLIITGIGLFIAWVLPFVLI